MRRPALPASAVKPCGLWRCVLLVSVIGGILGMHVLTGGDVSTGHGPLPATAHSVHAAELPATGTGQVHTAPAAADTTSFDADVTLATADRSDPDGSGMDHGGMAACILFLVVGGAAMLIALSTMRGRGLGEYVAGSVGAHAAGVMRRGPPGPGLPRLALCVDRI